MSNNLHTHVVIMAGGIGSRLWPLSTPEHPKQFIDVLGTGRSLLQMTVDRFLPVCDISRFWVVTSERYADMVANQLPDMSRDHILLEPVARNTAPCIAYASWKIHAEDPDANIVVTPSDALVTGVDAFADMVSKALAFTESGERIVTIGITPDRPETGYGYICAESPGRRQVTKVSAFKEKPCLEVAKEYLSAGNYYWNAGIFVWRASTILSQIRKYAPGIAAIMDSIAVTFDTEKENSAIHKYFPQCESISVDYAIMEKSDSIFVISDNVGWSDLGSWSSVRDHLPQDENGNAVIGNAILHGCHNCIAHTSNDSQKIVVNGLDSCIISEHDGYILISTIADEQEIKNISK